jgi:hypothetical protein
MESAISRRGYRGKKQTPKGGEPKPLEVCVDFSGRRRRSMDRAQEKNSSSLPAQPASLSAAPCFIFFLFSRPDISAHSSNPPRDAASGHISAAPTCNHPKPFAHPHPHTYISLPQRFQQRVRCRICFQQLYFLFFSSKVVVPVEYTYIIGCIS